MIQINRSHPFSQLYTSMNSYETQIQNDIKGLRWVAMFGLLRTVELGGLLWPNTSKSSATKQANRLVLHWRKKGFVIERILPGRCGRALVLALNGVRFLQKEASIYASSGKDIGRFSGEENGIWLPPSAWKHDILAASFLVCLHQKGWEIYPENYIRRRLFEGAARKKSYANESKIPDGLALKGDQVAWIEVESSTKTGTSQRHLVENLIGASTQNLRILGHKCTLAMVVFDPNATDYKGHHIDHKQRILNAIAGQTLKKVKITFAKAEDISSYSALNFDFEILAVGSTKVNELYEKLERLGWEDDGDEGFKLTYRNTYRAIIRPEFMGGDDILGWHASVNGSPFNSDSYCNSLGEAKRLAAKIICELQSKD